MKECRFVFSPEDDKKHLDLIRSVLEFESVFFQKKTNKKKTDWPPHYKFIHT